MKKNMAFAWLFLAAELMNGVCAAADLKQVNVYPNPVRSYIGDNQVTFDNVTAQFRLWIYSVNGTLVREVNQNGSATQYVWDLTNDAGNKIVSGTYIYLITNDSNQKKSGKILVIR